MLSLVSVMQDRTAMAVALLERELETLLVCCVVAMRSGLCVAGTCAQVPVREKAPKVGVLLLCVAWLRPDSCILQVREQCLLQVPVREKALKVGVLLLCVAWLRPVCCILQVREQSLF